MKLLKPLRLDFRKASLACLSGALLFLSFPPASLFPLSFIAFLPLLWALEGSSPRRAFLLGWASGAFYFVLLLHWIVLNPAVEAWVKPLLYLGVVLIGLFQGLFWAVPAAASRWLSDKSGLPIWASFPALFTVFDWLRGLGLLGFTWGSPGYALARWTDALQMASVGGLWLVTLWTVLISGLVFWAAHPFLGRPPQAASGRMRTLLPRLLALAAAVFIPPLAGIPVKRAVESLEAPAPVFTVALVQGNIDQGMRWDREFQEYNWTEYRRLTQEAAAHKPDLVVWPETAMPFYFQDPTPFSEAVRRGTEELNTPVLAGAPAYSVPMEPGAPQYVLHNRAYLLGPRGQTLSWYDKEHLVPFGEYVPLGKWLPFIAKLVPGQFEFRPGLNAAPLATGPLAMGLLICYEAIFPELAQKQVERGANVLVNISNDAWFGRSSAPLQHLHLAVLRAVEQNRAIIRATNTGISVFIGPDGRMRGATELFAPAIAHDPRVPLLTETTFYHEHFLLIHSTLPLLCVALLAWLGWNGRKNRT